MYFLLKKNYNLSIEVYIIFGGGWEEKNAQKGADLRGFLGEMIFFNSWKAQKNGRCSAAIVTRYRINIRLE